MTSEKVQSPAERFLNRNSEQAQMIREYMQVNPTIDGHKATKVVGFNLYRHGAALLDAMFQTGELKRVKITGLNKYRYMKNVHRPA